MVQTQVCCRYDGSFAGFLSCVFECYVNREEPVEFYTQEDERLSLYPERVIATRRDRAERIYRSLAARFGPAGRRLVTRGFLTCLEDREVWLWRLILLGYRRGPSVIRDLTHPAVHQVWTAVRHLEHEAHLLKGFVRFSLLDGVLVGEIEPKNRVLPLLRPHFCSRYPQETFLLYDRTHREGLLYQGGQWAIVPLEDLRMGQPEEEEEALYRRLWRSFYDAISIRERYNPRCRMTHMPKRYWGTMTEFQREEPSPPDGALPSDVPVLPAGRA